MTPKIIELLGSDLAPITDLAGIPILALSYGEILSPPAKLTVLLSIGLYLLARVLVLTVSRNPT